MFGSPLDNMLAQYTQYRQAEPTGAPVTAPLQTTPAPGGPGSFFSAASNVTAGANSIGSSPFGMGIPDLSKADPATLARLSAAMDGLIYNASTPGGGYIYGNTFKPGTQILNQHYIGQPPKNDPNADRAASDYYNFIGGLPTRPIGTRALNSLPGYTPSSGPSYNNTLGSIGLGPYSGPYEFPNWRND